MTSTAASPDEILARAGLTPDALYDELTDGATRSLRLEGLMSAAAERVPGLVPTVEEMEAERARPLAEKRQVELAQGLLTAQFLASPRTGRHLVEAMLEPTPEALERIDEFRDSGFVDLGPARVTRSGKA